MHTFQINVLTQFLVSSTSFKNHMFHHQEDHLYIQFCMVCLSHIYVSSLTGGRMYKWSSWWWTHNVQNM